MRATFCQRMSVLRESAVALGVAGILLGLVFTGASVRVALSQPTSHVETRVNQIGERTAKLETEVINLKASVVRIEDTLSKFFFMTLGAFFSGLVGAGGLVYGIKQRPARK